MTPSDWSTLHPPRLIDTPHLDRSARHLLGLRAHRNMVAMEQRMAAIVEVMQGPAAHRWGINTLIGFFRYDQRTD